MNVSLIAAVTADGYIGRDSDHYVDWTSKQDKGTFVRVTKQAGVIVMGANTFRTIGRALPGRRMIVYTRHPEQITAEGVETTSESPADLVARLEKAGAQGLAVAGGTQIYDMFMQAGVIHDLYIVTEPVLLGSGLNLFTKSLQTPIELVETTVKRGTSVVNHFRVLHDKASE